MSSLMIIEPAWVCYTWVNWQEKGHRCMLSVSQSRSKEVLGWGWGEYRIKTKSSEHSSKHKKKKTFISLRECDKLWRRVSLPGPFQERRANKMWISFVVPPWLFRLRGKSVVLAITRSNTAKTGQTALSVVSTIVWSFFAICRPDQSSQRKH